MIIWQAVMDSLKINTFTDISLYLSPSFALTLYTSMYILHDVLYTFPKVLIRRICLTIKSFFSWWSFPFFLVTPSCLIRGWYCNQRFVASNCITCSKCCLSCRCLTFTSCTHISHIDLLYILWFNTLIRIGKVMVKFYKIEYQSLQLGAGTLHWLLKNM